MRLAIQSVDMNGFLGAVSALFLNRPGAVDNGKEDGDEPRDPVTKGTVLMIDDDECLLDTVRPLLKEAGFTVLTSMSGAKGLDMLRYAQKDVRVVLLDYNMPRLSGAETLQYLRKISPRAKVVAISGVAAELLPEEFRANADRFMPKPFRVAELVRAIEELTAVELPSAAA